MSGFLIYVYSQGIFALTGRLLWPIPCQLPGLQELYFFAGRLFVLPQVVPVPASDPAASLVVAAVVGLAVAPALVVAGVVVDHLSLLVDSDFAFP